ncbi:MAG: ABC transporter ATP-binding protein [Chloroflexota bacterium]
MLLQLDTISSYYGQIQALKGISLHVNKGEIVALIGGNGAGKTTLLNSISGLMNPRQGKIKFDGQDITKMGAVQIVGLGISHVPEHRQLFGTMTVYENLILGAYHRHRKSSQRDLDNDAAEVYDVFPRLKERTKQLAGTLSGGEQQMLAIGRGLMAKPKLMLLDEPSLGLAPLLAKDLFEVIASLREHGQTVLLVEQNARAALKLADRAYVVETGSIALEGEASALLTDERVQAAYLGGGH